MIKSVKIQGMRGIADGKVDDLAPLSVLVGPNGCGKSSVLEAVLIGASSQPSQAIWQAVNRREQQIPRAARWLLWRGGRGGCRISLTSSSGSREFVLSGAESGGAKYLMTFEIKGVGTGQIAFPGKDSPPSQTPLAMSGITDIRLVDARTFTLDVPMSRLYSDAVEGGRRQQAKGLIKAVVPGLTDIEILEDGGKPVVHLVFADHSVPVAFAGDGVHTLFRICFHLASVGGGVVLLEEPEAHQHPAAIQQGATAIWAAIKQGAQIIMTTHSLELIDALVRTSPKDRLSDLALFRTQLRDGVFSAHRRSGDDVKFARQEIEEDLR